MVLAIQETDAAINPDLMEKSAFHVVRNQSSKRRKTERISVPEVYTFGAVEVHPFNSVFMSRH